MKITGFITEYNPFHKGHLYHLEQAKQQTGADYTIALMSGSYVQRGEPAVYDKYIRAEMALRAGVDLVLEMPVCFSSASAMEFATYGVALFTALGAVDTLVFGSECGNITALKTAAGLLTEESPAFQEALSTFLKEGRTYPQARKEALLKTLRKEPASSQPSLSELETLLLSPNNILGIEYIKAGLSLHSPLHFHTIRREGSGYHDAVFPEKNAFPSASAIRSALREPAAFPDLSEWIPAPCLNILAGETPMFADDFSLLLQDRILNHSLEDISDLAPELGARLKKAGPRPLSFTGQVQALKSRQFTYTRVSRALLHLILEIRASQLTQWKAEGYASYARILGFRAKSAPLLTQLKKSSSLPLITKIADAPKQLEESALAMLKQEIRVSHLYQLVKAQKGGHFRNEYTEGVRIC